MSMPPLNSALTSMGEVSSTLGVESSPSAIIAVMVWVALPLMVGFLSYLFANYNRHLAITVSLTSLTYGIYRLFDASTSLLQLLDSFGVALRIDTLSVHFLLTNAAVTTAVILYSWSQKKPSFFYTQLIILHGSVNGAFMCSDFMSLYVALEVISVAAFLLITVSKTHRALWIGLRYLLVSNTAMLFYLMGAVLVYQRSDSFAYAGLQDAPQGAIALIVGGLLTKGGVFISGLWLPQTHAEADTPVSALLSGAVVKTGIFPLVRCALLAEELAGLMALLGIATAGLGVIYAITAPDTKRTLAASTVSQMGFLLVAPGVAGFYALTHGLAKASLFLIAGTLPSRKFAVLRRSPIPVYLWILAAIAGLSIAGFPLLAGFGAKTLALKQIPAWQSWAMTTISVGTAIAMAKFLWIPIATHSSTAPSSDRHNSSPLKTTATDRGCWLALLLLTGGLLLANALHYDVYTVPNIRKALITVGIGIVSYRLTQPASITIPTIKTSRMENLEHLIGAMSLVLALLFWMVEI